MFHLLKMNFTRIILLLTLLLLQLTTNAQKIYYVDSATGDDTNSGTSWATAFRNIAKAVTIANADTAGEVDIWIAAGTYNPLDGVSPRPINYFDVSFTFYRGNGLGKALKVYGGFAGTEKTIAERDTSHITYLDGKISGGGYSHHVIVIVGLSKDADSVVVDGFTIRNGHPDYGLTSYNGIMVNGNFGGGVLLANDSSSKLLIANCKIVLNKSNYGSGAGMSIVASNPFVNSCSFKYDSTTSGGGAMYIQNASPLISHCDFYCNYDIGAGGAAYIDSASPLIIDCKFAGNRIDQGYLYTGGGAIYNNMSASRIENCSFTSNTSSAVDYANGGAIYNFGSSYFPLLSPAIINSSFTNNLTTINSYGVAAGGAMYNFECSPVIIGCDFNSNVAYSIGACGGAVYNWFSNPQIDGCIFKANITHTDKLRGGDAFGGALYNYFSPQQITKSSFISDTAYANDLGRGWGGAIYNYNSPAAYDRCIFNSNIASDSMTETGYGGTMFNDYSFIKVYGCNFKDNVATTGGAIYHKDGWLTLSGNSFANNMAGAGGAIFQDAYYASYLFNCHNNIFAYNKSTFGGGAINCYASYSPDTFYNNIFVGNKDSAIGGGAMYLTNHSCFVANNTFYKDSAENGGKGGAILLNYPTDSFTLANNIFYKNYGAGATIDTSFWHGTSDTSVNNIYSGTDPKFVNEIDLKGSDSIWGTNDDGLELQACSPARNNGNNVFVVGDEKTDITGAARIESGIVDIGAYETTPIPEPEGSKDVCIGYTISLSDSIKGGIWISKNTSIATIDSTGLVKSIAIGIDTILYIVKGSCSTDTLYTAIRVNPTTVIGPITGITTVCPGAITILSDSITGGNWTASNRNATVYNGIVTAVKTGIDTITYTNGCGRASAKTVVTILPAPDAGIIIGLDTLCAGKSTLLIDTVTGGKWSSSNKFASVLSTGLVAGNSSGKDTIIYTVTGATCKSEATKSIYIKDCRTLVKNVSSANAKMDIYPNPNRGTFTINIAYEKDENIRVSITDITGKKVNDFNIATNKPATIKLNQPAGLYFLSASTKNGRYNAKIIVE